MNKQCFQYRNHHYKDNSNPYHWEDGLYIHPGPVCLVKVKLINSEVFEERKHWSFGPCHYVKHTLYNPTIISNFVGQYMNRILRLDLLWKLKYVFTDAIRKFYLESMHTGWITSHSNVCVHSYITHFLIMERVHVDSAANLNILSHFDSQMASLK